jgi:transcriptional regulator with XRE-family HTH domain
VFVDKEGKTRMNEQDFFKWLGEKIQKFRKDAKMTQREVCVQVGLYEADLSSFENHGKKIQNAFTINEIILATGHTWKDLFRESDPEKKTPKSRSQSPRLQMATAGMM